MGEPDRIAPLSVSAAAQRLGLSEVGTRGLIASGQLRPVVRTPSIRLAALDVEDLRVARRDAAVAEFTARGVDLVKLAAGTRRALRPEPADPLPGGVRGLSGLPSNVRAFFGPAALMALTLSDREQCGWCAARVAAGLLRVPEPRYGDVFHALLGDPCASDMKRFAGAELAKLRARVHPGGTRSSGARTAPVAALTAVSPATSPAPPRTPAQPVQPDDGGRALVASRLRTARARLKDAKRHGDTRYAIRLRQTIQGLERDAAVVDGRVTAAARPGRLRCGHLLSAACSCPRRASSRGQR
jgi:hypothetical protein